ncbi:MAG: STAS/SEC14 domain-containing protein [Cytophagaceae bacterium]|jgi:hypothetical protein|nr:STAS/SEC14 domain-containing protein [Cytophagaceae bacterium]
MEKHLFFSERYCEIYFVPEAGCSYLDIIGSFSFEEYKTMFGKFLECILHHDCAGMVADQRRSKGSNMEMRSWLVMTWLPELKKQVKNPSFKVAGINTEKAGFKKFISVYLEKAVNMVTGMNTKAFENLEDALAWVKSDSD